MTAEQLIEILQQYCQRAKVSIWFTANDVIAERDKHGTLVRGYSATELADVLNNHDERECHKELLKIAMNITCFEDEAFTKAKLASQNALAQSKERNG